LASCLDFNASIAIKHPGLMSFGTASWIQNDTVGFTAEAKLVIGEKSQVRLNLSRIPNMVIADIVEASKKESQTLSIAQTLSRSCGSRGQPFKVG
jgi:hypothetical protein